MGCGLSRESASYVAATSYTEDGANKCQQDQQNKHRVIETAPTQSDDTSCYSPKKSPISGMVKDEKCFGLKNLERNGVRYEGPNGKQIEDVYEGVFDATRDICRSVAGCVRRVTHKQSQINYAVKIFSLEKLSEKGTQQLLEEVRILSEVDHPNIVRLEEVYQTETDIYLVQELCEGGDLFNFVRNPDEYKAKDLSAEERCAEIVRQMLSALRYLNSKGIVHRDMKLENVLFEKKDANSKVKIIDFGLSKHFKPGETHTEYVGSVYTMAPEVIRKNYDERCDVWSIGVIAFILLCGKAPFGGCYGEKDQKPIKARITRGFYRFEPTDVWKNRSREAKEFVCKLLKVDLDRRPTLEQAQNLPWLLNHR